MKNNKNAFTLIEILVAMTMMIILTMAAYIPFSHYQQKQRVRNSAKIITQTLYDARSDAIYGRASNTGNLDIGVLFKQNATNLKVYGFPIKDTISNYLNPDNKYLLEKISLEPGVQISSSGGLFLFKAITGSGVYKNFTINSNKIELSVGLKGATHGIMSKKIEYFVNTYISDVK